MLRVHSSDGFSLANIYYAAEAESLGIEMCDKRVSRRCSLSSLCFGPLFELVLFEASSCSQARSRHQCRPGAPCQATVRGTAATLHRAGSFR